MGALTKLRESIRRSNSAALVRMNTARLVDRQTDELIGMVRMALADGVLEVHEADFMLRWLEVNDHARAQWPGKMIYSRLCAALADDELSSEEEGELLDLLVRAIGSPRPEAASTTLPLDMPAPRIDFGGRLFCFTGRFYSGSRDWCAQQVLARGGRTIDRLTLDVHYLVVGQSGSPDWLHSSHGRKIQAAVRYKEKGGSKIAIIAEECWAAAL